MLGTASGFGGSEQNSSQSELMQQNLQSCKSLQTWISATSEFDAVGSVLEGRQRQRGRAAFCLFKKISVPLDCHKTAKLFVTDAKIMDVNSLKQGI